MDDSGDVLIAMKELEVCLNKELETLPPLSKACSIYRVAEPMRRLKQNDYTPQMVSIGPYHHDKPELKATEAHKQRYLKCYLQRTKVRIARFLAFIKESEAELRNCYAEATDNLQSEKFVKMVLVDAVFLIELFLRFHDSGLRTDDDRLFGKQRLLSEVCCDLWLVENQLPLFIIKGLYDLAKEATDDDDTYNKISFATITCSFVRGVMDGHLPTEDNLLESHFSEAKHFIDLIILCLQRSQPPDESELTNPNIPSVKELHRAGVKFEPDAESTRNLFNFTFDGRILKIPPLTVYDQTERLFRNLLAFETMHGCPKYLNDYIIMMSCLVNAREDAELLIRNKIIGLGDTKTLPTLFHNNLNRQCVIDYSDFQYSGVVAALQDYCKSPWNEWKANLKQNYFNTPWASISVIAAVILLLLTSIQTVCSLIAL